MALGEKLKNLRKENKLSQEKVAELVGVSRQAVSKWETGLSNPDTENLICLANIFHVSIDEITDPPIACGRIPEQVKTPAIRHKIFQPIAAYTGFMIAYRIKTNEAGFYLFITILILICGIFMAWNIWSEPEKKHRHKNALIELGYCLSIYLIMTIGSLTIGNIFSGLIATICCIVYLKIINPKFMERKIFNNAE